MFTEGMTPIRVLYTLIRYGEDGAKDFIDAFQNREKGFQTFQRIISPFKNLTRADIKGLLRRDYKEQIESDSMFQSLDKQTSTIIRELSVLLAFVAQGIDKPVEDMNISELISAFVEETDSTKKERIAGLLFKTIKGRVNYERTKKKDGSQVSKEELKDAFNSIYSPLEGVGELDDKEKFLTELNATGQLHSALLVLAYESEGSVARKIAFFPIDELDVGGQYRKLGIDTPTDRKFVSVIYPDLWENLELPKPRKDSFTDKVSAEGATSRREYQIVNDSETTVNYIKFLANEKSQKRKGSVPASIIKTLVPKIAGRDMTKPNTIVFNKSKKGYIMNTYLRQFFEEGQSYLEGLLRGTTKVSDEDILSYFPGELGKGLRDRFFAFLDDESYRDAIEILEEEEIPYKEEERNNVVLLDNLSDLGAFRKEIEEDSLNYTQSEIEQDVKSIPISTSLQTTNEYFLPTKEGEEGARLGIETLYKIGVTYESLEPLLTEEGDQQFTNEEFGKKLLETSMKFKNEFDEAVLAKLNEIIEKREKYEKEFPQIFKELGYYDLITESEGE